MRISWLVYLDNGIYRFVITDDNGESFVYLYDDNRMTVHCVTTGETFGHIDCFQSSRWIDADSAYHHVRNNWQRFI